VQMYFVSSCNVFAAGQTACTTDADNGRPVPTLKRYELGADGNWRTVAIAEGVQNMKVEYGIDTNNDGAPDVYRNCAATSCTNADWANVTGMRVHLLVRNSETTVGYNDDKTYTLGGTAVPAFNDAYKRRVYTQFVRLANPAGRREIP
jgi:type IV pilus assembly protein PilW